MDSTNFPYVDFGINVSKIKFRSAAESNGEKSSCPELATTSLRKRPLGELKARHVDWDSLFGQV
jgi:hypothetical protein